MIDPDFLDVSEAAARLGISDDLVYDLVHRGLLPAATFGRRMKVPTRAIDLVVERALDGFDPDAVLARLSANQAGASPPPHGEAPSWQAGRTRHGPRRTPAALAPT